MWDNYVSIYISHMNSLQAKMWPEKLVYIHTIYITGICLRTNMPIHIYVPLPFYCSLHKSISYNINLPYYCRICANNKYVPQCQKYATFQYYSMCLYVGSIPIHMLHMKLCQSMMLPELLYIDSDNDDNGNAGKWWWWHSPVTYTELVTWPS